MTWNSDAVDVNLLIDSMNQQIGHLEYGAACREPPSKDGYGGLIRICDDQMFRERGFIREYVPQPQRSPGTSSAVNTGSGPSDMDALSDSSYQVAFGESEIAAEELHGPRQVEDLKTTKLEEQTKEHIRPRSLASELGADSPDSHPPLSRLKTLPESALKAARESSDVGISATLQEDSNPKGLQNLATSLSNVKYKNEVEKWHAELELLRSGKVLLGEKALTAAFIADQAFRAAIGNLQSGDFKQAVQLAEIAAGACPADKLSARDKINRLKQVAIRRLQIS